MAGWLWACVVCVDQQCLFYESVLRNVSQDWFRWETFIRLLCYSVSRKRNRVLFCCGNNVGRYSIVVRFRIGFSTNNATNNAVWPLALKKLLWCSSCKANGIGWAEEEEQILSWMNPIACWYNHFSVWFYDASMLHLVEFRPNLQVWSRDA